MQSNLPLIENEGFVHTRLSIRALIWRIKQIIDNKNKIKMLTNALMTLFKSKEVILV